MREHSRGLHLLRLSSMLMLLLLFCHPCGDIGAMGPVLQVDREVLEFGPWPRVIDLAWAVVLSSRETNYVSRLHRTRRCCSSTHAAEPELGTGRGRRARLVRFRDDLEPIVCVFFPE